MGKVRVYMCLHIASIKSTAGNKTSLFPSTFLIFTSRFLTLAKAFRNDHVFDNNLLQCEYTTSFLSVSYSCIRHYSRSLCFARGMLDQRLTW